MNQDIKILELHEKLKKTSTNDLILILNELVKDENVNKVLIKIVKTYLVRALNNEGIR